MEYNLLKSKLDKYQIHEATVTRSTGSMRIDMKLKHITTQVQTTGTLILNMQNQPDIIHQDLETINKRNKILDDLIHHLETTSYVREDSRFIFKPNDASVLINTLFPNIKAEIMIDKSKHRKQYKRDEIISRTTNMSYPNVNGLSINMEKNSIDMYALEGNIKSLKHLVDIITEQYLMDEPKVDYYFSTAKGEAN